MRSAFGTLHRPAFGRSTSKTATTSETEASEQKVLQVDDLLQTAQKIAPVVRSFTESSAYEDVEVIKAKLVNQRRLRDTLPEPLKTFYANNVRILEAKLKAAKHAKVLEARDRASSREWAFLGKGTAVTGIAVGAALVVLILSRSRS